MESRERMCGCGMALYFQLLSRPDVFVVYIRTHLFFIPLDLYSLLSIGCPPSSFTLKACILPCLIICSANANIFFAADSSQFVELLKYISVSRRPSLCHVTHLEIGGLYVKYPQCFFYDSLFLYIWESISRIQRKQ